MAFKWYLKAPRWIFCVISVQLIKPIKLSERFDGVQIWVDSSRSLVCLGGKLKVSFGSSHQTPLL